MSTLSLGLTASSGPCAVAIRTRDGAVHGAPHAADLRGDDLAAQVARLFEDLNEAPAALEEIRLDLGPGSYTGLRIAVTFARALHVFLGIPVLTATSLQLMALAAWREGLVAESRRIRPILDARRNRFHNALVEFTDGVRLTEPPRAVGREELLESIRADEVLLADEGLHKMLGEAAARAGARVVGRLDFAAGLLFDARLQLTNCAGDQLQPLYLMGSYAD